MKYSGFLCCTLAEYENQQGEDMSATMELFERYKMKIGVYTDGAGAASLGVKSQTVSNWRTRGSQAEPRLIEKMAATIDADAGEWLLRVQVEQSFDTSNKEVWRRLSQKLGYKLGCVAVLSASAVAQFGCRLGMLAEDLACGASGIAAVTDRLMILL
jgi:hypothetical protein